MITRVTWTAEIAGHGEADAESYRAAHRAETQINVAGRTCLVTRFASLARGPQGPESAFDATVEEVANAELLTVNCAQLPWRCFHCDQILFTEDGARKHFGPDEGSRPACQIKGSEGGLIEALRQAESEVLRLQFTLHTEGGETLTGWRAADGRHDRAVRSAEETGYERGLADARLIEPAVAEAVAGLRTRTSGGHAGTGLTIVDTHQLDTVLGHFSDPAQ